MPLWIIYHPDGTFEDDASREALAAEITTIYTGIGLPAFYVITNFVKMPGNTMLVGGKKVTGKPFIRIVVEHIAVRLPNEDETYRKTSNAIDAVLKPHIADKGYDWEFHVDETERRLWKVNDNLSALEFRISIYSVRTPKFSTRVRIISPFTKKGYMGPRDLNHHSKLPMMLRLHGSITPRLILPVLLIGAWATAITCISKLVYDLGTDQVFITVLGFVVSLALSVRSSTSMDRYFQGRQLWGRLRLASHVIGRLVWIHVMERHDIDAALGKQDLLGKVSCLNLLVAFAVAVKHKLRFEPGIHYDDLKHLVGHLDTFAQAANIPAPDPPSPFRRNCQLLGIPMATSNPRKQVKAASSPLGDLPLEILSHLSAYMKTPYDNGTLRDYSVYQTQSLDTLTIMDEVSCGTEKILNTPIPLAYSIAISQVTWLYILLLPFQCYNSLGWVTIPACVVAAYIILGIAFIGREIEDPFGYDVNDLPLDAFCHQIRQDMDIIMSRAAPLVSEFMEREENMPLYPLSYLSWRAWADKSPEEIHMALSQKAGLHHPLVERGEHPMPPPLGRMGTANIWTEKGVSRQGSTIGAGHPSRRYGSV
ncbi:UPF0187-like protein [Stemphylium lycopersici]|nr:UPF0187-like protein [Stemphylium lycopersici]